MGLFGLVLFVFLPVRQYINAQGSVSTVSVEAGAIRIKQSNREALVSPTLSVSARRATARMALTGSALLVQSSDNASASQIMLGGEFLVPGAPSLRLEASGSGTFFDAPTGNRETSTSALVRAHGVRERYGAFLTAGSGVIGRELANFHAFKWDAGGWARRGVFSGTVTMRRSYTRDYPLVEESEFALTDSVTFSVRDFEGIVAARLRRLELQASGTWRQGFGATVGHTNAFAMSATVHLNSRLAISANAGKQLAEWLTGIPTARVIGVSARLNVLGASPRGAAAPRGGVTPAFAAQVVRHAAGGATVRIRVDASPNARVELSGTFNDWTVLPMSRNGDVFEHTLELRSGTHRIAVRINGGDWKAPVGLARIKDDLGGEAGLVVVP